MSRKPGKNWRLRQRVKFWLGNQFSPTRGRIRYCSTKVYFPPGHELFYRLCASGIYEGNLLAEIRKHLPADGVLYDIGGNIGLTAVPILNAMPRCRVVSFEPSPNSLPFLKKTHESSSWKNRWTIIDKAVGESNGQVQFSIGAESDGAFDGRGATGRRESITNAFVPMTTLDAAWRALGNEPVSVIKIDVEGFEKEVLAGARQCLADQRPVVILEWSKANLDGLNRDPLELLSIAGDIGYEVITMTSGRHVPNKTMLDFELLSGENFVLFPVRR